MAILIVVLQTDALGATLKKGLLYIAGTLTGAIASVAMVGLFANDRRLFILGMALLTGFGVYRMQGSRYPYAWLIFVVTSALVGWLSAQSTGVTFELAVMRASTICVGIVVAFSIHGILWPIKAGRTFERQLHGFLEGCRDLLSFTSQALAGEEPDPETAKRSEAAQVKTIAALRSSLDAASADTDRFRRFHGRVRPVDRSASRSSAGHPRCRTRASRAPETFRQVESSNTGSKPLSRCPRAARRRNGRARP